MQDHIFLTANSLIYFFYAPEKSSDSNPAELLNAIMMVVWVFTTIFFVCELGEDVTHYFNVFDEELCNCDWYLFSLTMKRIYLIVLTGAEQPAVIQGYGSTVCTRAAFKTVIIFSIPFEQIT